MDVNDSTGITVKEEVVSSLSSRPEGQSNPVGSSGLVKEEDDHNMGDAASSVILPAQGDPHDEDTKPVLPSTAEGAKPNGLQPQIPDLAPPQPPAQVDPDLFLTFQTEEDKKVKVEQEDSSTNDGPRRSGRVQPARNGLSRSQGSARKLELPDEAAAANGNRKPATRAKKEEDDMDEDFASGNSDSEDEKPEASMRKPGQPVSIAHLPVATEEVGRSHLKWEALHHSDMIPVFNTGHGNLRRTGSLLVPEQIPRADAAAGRLDGLRLPL